MNTQNKIDLITAWFDSGMSYEEGMKLLKLFPEKMGLLMKLTRKHPHRTAARRLERALVRIYTGLRIEKLKTM